MAKTDHAKSLMLYGEGVDRRYRATKSAAESRLERDLTHTEFVELLLDVYDLHLD